MRSTTLAFLADFRRDRLVPVAERLVDTIERENPAYRADVVPRTDLWRSCHDNVERILELLTEAIDGGLADHGDDDEVYDAARATGLRRAQQGMALDEVLRSFRFGGRAIWQDLVDQGDPALDAAELREIGSLLWEVVDDTSAQVAIAYHEHERSLVRADEQQRAELWEGVLGGRAREPGFAHDAAMVLDLPIVADLVVVAAYALDRTGADRRLAPHATVWVQRSEGVVGIVVLRDDTTEEVRSALARVALEQQVPLGVSKVVPGLAAVDEGYRQAALALWAQGRTPGLAALDERLPEALLLSSPDVAAYLVTRWVEPITRLPQVEAQSLLRTLTAWVEHAGSATRTATAVHCHRNTVVNRLRRVSDLTGAPLGEIPPIELDLALRAWRMGQGSAHPRG